MTASRVVYVYGCEHADIVTPGATPVYQDIPGMREVALGVSQTALENYGDDDILDVWVHSQKATVDLTFATTDLTVIAALKGNTVATAGSGAQQVDRLDFGTAAEMVKSNVMLRAKIVTQSADTGVPRYFYIWLYNVKPIECSNTGIKEKGEMLWKFSGTAIRSALDELTGAVSPKARGRYEIAA